MRELVAVVVVVVAGCHTGAHAPRPELPSREAPLVEGTFSYERSYLFDRLRFAHAYADGAGRRVVVASAAREPTELERVARIRYRAAARTERFAPLDGSAPVDVALAGDVVSVAPIPIEDGALHVVASYLTACANVDVTAQVYESAGGDVRLVVDGVRAPYRAVGGDAREVRMRYRRVPPHDESYVAWACAGDARAHVLVTAVAVPP